MSSLWLLEPVGGGSAWALFPPAGSAIGHGLQTLVKQRLPTDPIGTFGLTLTNLVVGSAIRVETQAGALIEFRVAASASETFLVPAYAGGNPSNNLRIKVRKGTAAPKYQPFETLATAIVGSQSVYIAQVPDRIA